MRREFERTTPEAVGIPSSAIERLLDALEGAGHTQMHGIMIMRGGKVCAEGHWAPFAANQVHSDHSLSKTYTATAVGICQREGLLSLDQPVIDFFPDKVSANPDERLKKLTIRHLLIMGSGLPAEQRGYPSDWIERHFAAGFLHEPGTVWRYDSHGSTLLAAIVEKVTGMSMTDWLARKLFRIIGIDESRVLCRRTDDGICNGGGGMFTTAEDNLRLMKLYLDGGVWDGERILSEEFVREATGRQIDNREAQAGSPWIYDNMVGYGYQMWMCRPDGAYRSDGAFGQFGVVVPSEDLIVSILEAGRCREGLRTSDLLLPDALKGEDRPVYSPQITLDLLFGILLPELKPEALPENPAASHHLAERLSRLSLPVAWGRELPDWNGHLSFSELEAVEQGIGFGPYAGTGCADHLSLTEDRGSLTLVLRCGKDTREMKADLTGIRQQGRLSFAESGEILSKVSCSAWFTQEGSLCLSVLWYETELESRYTFIRDRDLVHAERTVFQGFAVLEGPEKAVYRIV